MKSEINKSGLLPIEFKVLIELDEIGKMTKSGKLFVPDTVREIEQMKQVKATLIAAGGNAFEDMLAPIPKVGDRVYVARAAGYNVTGKDGKQYRLMNDKDIAAIIIEE